jgi:hypothetical protein
MDFSNFKFNFLNGRDMMTSRDAKEDKEMVVERRKLDTEECVSDVRPFLRSPFISATE